MSCEYCKDDNSKEIVSITDKNVIIYKSGDMFRVDFKDDSYGMQSELIDFKYCPMCGGKINSIVNNHYIGNRILSIRERLGLNQNEFADKINATVSAVSNWENGRNKPNKKRLKSISEIGGITVANLLGEDDSNEKSNDYRFRQKTN